MTQNMVQKAVIVVQGSSDEEWRSGSLSRLELENTARLIFNSAKNNGNGCHNNTEQP